MANMNSDPPAFQNINLGANSGPKINFQPPKKRFKRMTLTDYLKGELTRGYQLELEEERYEARREKVYTFMNIPREVEKLMGYGFFQCADAFLFLFTFLPLRCLILIFNLLVRIKDDIISPRPQFRRITHYLKTCERCDMLKLLIFSMSVSLFTYIDTSVLYHMIKSQSVIKLYIFFNMLEVGDRLFASFVQDTLDALFLTATKKQDDKDHMSVSAHMLLSLFSVLGHSVVILLQATTISVAVNASNRALLTVMMSNNFVELKGAVFKKFDKINLFQVSCSDVRERFHLCVLLLIVCLQTMREYSWEESRFWILFPDCIMVLLAEIGVDWLKHAFITRFNEIPSTVYREYTLSLAYDLAQTKQRRAFSDHSDMVGRRLGFVPLPLAIVLARVFRPILKDLTTSTLILFVLGYIALASFRLLNSIILLGKACDLIDQHIKETSPNNNTTGQESTHNTASKSHGEEQGTLTRRLSRHVSSQPTTRTPSPNRNFPKYVGEIKESVEDLHQNSNGSQEFLFPQKSEGKSKFYRSFSASHTPRPSVVGLGENWKLGEAPSLPDASTALLMANSTVSILSVSLNEEMLRAAAKEVVKYPDKYHQEDKENVNIKLSSRRHSLGSRMDLNEFPSLKRENSKGNLLKDSNSHIDKFEPRDSMENLNLSDEVEGAAMVVDLDKTLIFDSKMDDEIFVADKENASGITEENKPILENPATVKQRKKKGLAWLHF